MKHLFTFSFLFLLVSCKSKPVLKPGDIYFEEIGWAINFPNNRNFQSSQQIDSLQKLTLKRLNEDPEKVMQRFKTLFSIIDNNRNAFNSSIEKPEPEYKTVKELHAADKDFVLRGLESQRSTMLMLDSSTSTEVVGGRTFERLYFELYFPNRLTKMKTYWYTTEINKYELSVSIGFVDEEMGNQYLQIFRQSKFDK